VLTNDEVVAIARIEVDQAQGYDADVLATVRENALDYYHGEMYSAPAGRSQFVSHDVADTVHALLSQVSKQFQSSIIVFAPESEEDEPQAQLESDAVRYQLEKYNGWTILNNSAHEALLSGNGWIKCDVEEVVDVTTETYAALAPLQLQAVQQPTAEDQTVQITEKDDRYTVRRETTTRKLVVESVASDVMIYSTETGIGDINELRMVGERKMFTSNELKRLGVSDDDIMSIPDYDSDYWPAVRAREGVYKDNTDERSTQESERKRECFEVYLNLDMNQDGKSERYRILFGGNTMIEGPEPVKCIPYATGSAVPLPHRVQGDGMYQLMHQVQDAKTGTMRQYLDNLAVMNGSRTAVDEAATNIEDLTNGRINGIVRTKGPPSNSIMPLPATDIGGQAITGLNYLDTVRSQRGGASVDQNDADRQLMQSSATAAAGMMESSERMAGWYCSNLVNTLLTDTYKLIHKKLRYDMPGQMQAKLRGKWVQTDPSQWLERNHIEVTAGRTSSENNQKQQALQLLLQQQQAWLQQGGEGIITDKSKIYNAAADWIRVTQLGQPEEYLIDPSSEEAQQAIQASQQAAEQAAAEQQQQMQNVMEIEAAKIAEDRYEKDTEIAWKYYDTNVDAEIQEAKITADSIIKLETANAKDDTDDERGSDDAGQRDTG
jgi:hypothetical protein